ncbi:MAG: elongation factor Ts [Gammaproteobacteria bacterium]|nr:elongation factor Ts [Gammaproteobacteria bacterium]
MSISISAQLIKELRERTGAGMMECKGALVAANGDIDSAVTELRKKGQAKADKKADRVVAEGMLVLKAAADQRHAVLVEVNCETDFVARDESFKEFAEASAIRALETGVQSVEALLAQPLLQNQPETIEQARQALIGQIGENIQVRRIHSLVAKLGVIATYMHGTRIGVMVELVGGDAQLGRDLAMHIAASKPSVISSEEVSADLIEKEKEIFMAQAAQSGKPAAIIEKMIAGRLSKFVDEVSLLGQPFIRDPGVTVGALLKKANATVVQFVRFEVGEGIEKKTDNFVEEVMAQVRTAQ